MRCVDARAARLERVTNQRRGRHWRERRLHTSRLHLRQVEQIGHQPLEAGCVLTAHLQDLALPFGRAAGKLFLQQLDAHLQCLQRRSQLMRRDADELGLEPVCVAVDARRQHERQREPDGDESAGKRHRHRQRSMGHVLRVCRLAQHRGLIELEQTIEVGAQMMEQRLEPGEVVRAPVEGAMVRLFRSPDVVDNLLFSGLGDVGGGARERCVETSAVLRDLAFRALRIAHQREQRAGVLSLEASFMFWAAMTDS